jgi:UDPglucose 6-dehydrogenase
MRVTMIGAGYVGLVSGACFADFGHHVTCIDKDAAKIAALNRGEIPIFEPGLAELVEANVRQGRLQFAAKATGVVEADAVMIAVGTPSRRGDGHADLSFVFDAVREIAPLLSRTAILVTKSTVPVGTGDEIERILRERRPDADMQVVSNPEFLREGAAIQDFKHPDRIVVGTDDTRARAVVAELYRPLYLNAAPILYVSRRTAELIKYASNAFLATKITFINEIADLCEQAGADVQDVARGMGLDNRIGGKFLHAGPGFGGSCFPKDATALLKTAHDHGVALRIVETVAAVNEQRKRAMARKVVSALDGSIRGKTVAVLGLTFKPNTDDTRDSPAIPLITALHDLGATVRAYDPAGMEQAKPHLPERSGRRRRGRGDRHRMGAVPRPRSRPAALRHGASGHRRSAQHLSRRRDETRQLPLPHGRAARGRAARGEGAAAPAQGERQARAGALERDGFRLNRLGARSRSHPRRLLKRKELVRLFKSAQLMQAERL